MGFNQLHFEDRASWRKWLEGNFDSTRELWLVFFKKHSGVWLFVALFTGIIWAFVQAHHLGFLYLISVAICFAYGCGKSSIELAAKEAEERRRTNNGKET